MEQMQLTHGPLAFSALVCGRPSDPVVLCLHGFPDNPHTFCHQLPALAEAGFRAIAPTMRGYEPSSQPVDGDYTIATMARDVIAWIDGLGAEKVHLVGHDWGAVITYVAGALAPERFHSLTTIAVPHGPRMWKGLRHVPVQFWKSWYMSFFQLPGIADWAVERDDWALLKRLCAVWSPGFALSDEEWAKRRATFEAPGVKSAMLAYYRQNVSPGVLLGWTESEARSLLTVPVPTLAITGAQDGCIDTRLYDHVFLDQDFPDGFHVERIEGAGHFAHLDAPEVVNRMLLDWLRSPAPSD
jgi:pimeloyl-ACP methyl ester carboxylesterase